MVGFMVGLWVGLGVGNPARRATCRKQEVKRESPAAAFFDHFFELRGAF